MAKNTKHTKGESIRLNDQTAGNLITYLQRFPANAKITITDNRPPYREYDVQIACNIAYQETNNKVMLILGQPV